MHRITPEDDAEIAAIIRSNLEHFHLNLPGTVYFDPELDHLSTFYCEALDKRAYFILSDTEDHVVGGVGYAEFDGYENCAELQKLYLTDTAKGHGLGKTHAACCERSAQSWISKIVSGDSFQSCNSDTYLQ